MQEDGQILLKVLSVGDTQVGKSCLIKRYCEERFVNKYITTIGVDYGVKKMNVLNKKTAINFFDLSGDDDYEEIRNPFFKDAQGVIMVFDLENRESFTNLIKWERIMKENGLDFNNSVIFVVGNKSDVRSKDVEQNEITQFVRKRGWEYFQTSANTGDNVKEVRKRFNILIFYDTIVLFLCKIIFQTEIFKQTVSQVIIKSIKNIIKGVLK